MAKSEVSSYPVQKAPFLRHPDSGEIFPWSASIAVNTYLIPTDEKPAWMKDEAPVKKGPFGRPVKTEVSEE